MIDLKRAVLESPLRFKLKGMGLDIFGEWSLRAAQKHHLAVTRIRAEVKGEQVEADILDHLVEGMGILLEERYSHKPMSWRYGFLCGYVRAKLTAGWHKRYLSLNSRQYEDLVKLAALREFIDQEPSTADSIHSIYNYRMSCMEENEVEEPALDEFSKTTDRPDAPGHEEPRDSAPPGVIFFPASKIPGKTRPGEIFGQELRKLLKDIIQEKLDLFFDREYGPSIDLCPPLDAHLPEADICGILKKLDEEVGTKG